MGGLLDQTPGEHSAGTGQRPCGAPHCRGGLLPCRPVLERQPDRHDLRRGTLCYGDDAAPPAGAGLPDIAATEAIGLEYRSDANNLPPGFLDRKCTSTVCYAVLRHE